MVWSARWFIGSILESNWVSLQLYFSPLWICHSAYRLCKVCNLNTILMFIFGYQSRKMGFWGFAQGLNSFSVSVFWSNFNFGPFVFNLIFWSPRVPKFRQILISFLNLNMVFGPVISSSNLTVYGGGLRLKKFENTMTKKAKLVTHAWKLSNWPEHQGPQKILILCLVY